MDISLQPISNNHGNLRILLQKQDINPEVSKELERIRKNAKIKGFRQGAVPSSMIQKLYGEGIRAEVLNKIVNNAVTEYQKEHELRFLGDLIPMNEPLADTDLLREEIEFVYEVGITPKINLDQFIASHSLKRYDIGFSSENIDAEVTSFIQHFSELQVIEDSIQEGDLILLKVKEVEDQKAGAEALESEFSVYLDENLHEDMRKLVAGKKTGEQFRFNIQHVEKNQNDNIVKKYFLHITDEQVGYSDMFDGEIIKVSRKVKPDLDKALFEKAFGPDTTVQNETDLREKLSDELKNFYIGESEKFLEYQVSELIKNDKTLAYPDDFLRKWLSTSFEEWQSKSSHDFEHDLIHFKEGLNWELYRSSIAATGEVQVKADDLRQIIINKYKAQIPGLQFTDEQWNQVAMNVLKDREKSNEFYHEALNARCIQWLQEKMTKEDVSISLDDFRSMIRDINQKAQAHQHEHHHHH
ncbi:MAG: trigger factor [Saprospiraceae bacterium]